VCSTYNEHEKERWLEWREIGFRATDRFVDCMTD
jgi:hypothetical protein